MARKANPQRASRPWAISMCITAMHWGNLLGMFGHLTIHDGKLLISTDRHNRLEHLQLPTGLTTAYAILSVIGWLSIPVMLISLVYIRESFNYTDQRFKKRAGIAFFGAGIAFILGILIGRFFEGFTVPYTP